MYFGGTRASKRYGGQYGRLHQQTQSASIVYAGVSQPACILAYRCRYNILYSAYSDCPNSGHNFMRFVRPSAQCCACLNAPGAACAVVNGIGIYLLDFHGVIGESAGCSGCSKASSVDSRKSVKVPFHSGTTSIKYKQFVYILCIQTIAKIPGGSFLLKKIWQQACKKWILCSWQVYPYLKINFMM